MATTMKDLEARLDVLEGRVEQLEGTTGTIRTEQELSRVEQIAHDKALVSRFVNSREEAIAQQAARERLADLGMIDERGALRDPGPLAEDVPDDEDDQEPADDA